MTCAIATVAPRGRAHLNTGYFAWSREFVIVWLSDPRDDVTAWRAAPLVASPPAGVVLCRYQPASDAWVRVAIA